MLPKFLTLTTALMLLMSGAAVAEPVTTELGLYVVDVTSIDELTSTFQIEIDVISRFQASERAFTPAPGGTDVRTTLDDAAVADLQASWSPVLNPMNEVGGATRTGLWVTTHADGTTEVRVRLLLTMRAPLDFREFPFDTQVLPIHVESLIWTSDRLTLEAEKDFTGFDEHFYLPEWTVLGLTTEHSRVLRPQEGETYDRLDFNLTIERKIGYYLWKIMLPMVLIVMLSWVVFWMSQDLLGRRAGISSTAMLTIIAYQFIVAGYLPRFPYLTVLDRFTLISLVAVAATMLINLLGTAMDEERRQRVDRICRLAFPTAYVLAVVLAL